MKRYPKTDYLGEGRSISSLQRCYNFTLKCLLGHFYECTSASVIVCNRGHGLLLQPCWFLRYAYTLLYLRTLIHETFRNSNKY